MKKQTEPKKKLLKVFFNANAPWANSGYSQQIAEILPRMVQAGYPVGISCFYGLEGGILDINGMRCYPKIGDPYGSDAMVEHSKAFGADVVFTLQDLWVVDPNMLKQLPRWIPIVPVDMEPIPESIYERLKMANRVISYSPYGQRELRRKGMHSTYIQHTVDTNIYKPMDKKEAKKAVGIPEDMFVFGMVSANKDNPPRKSFQKVMDAFKIFHDKHPNSCIYFHTLLEQGGGFNIKQYADFLGIQDSIYHLHPYQYLYGVGKADMPRIYNAFDVLLCPSLNEGFGVPIIEAQACGVPVITNNFTAMPDLIQKDVTGYLTEIEFKRFTPLGGYVGEPYTKDIYDNMEKIYTADREKMGKRARLFMQKEFDSDTIFKMKWLPLLARLEKEIYPDEKTS